jgi:hypothetical protein
VAAAAGARRTETAYPRFVQAQNGYDLITGGSSGNIDPARALTQIEAMPAVGQWARVDVAASTAILPSGRVAPAPELMAVTDLSGRAGFRLNRFKVISGRIANLHAPSEAMIDFPTADREDLRVGSIIRFIVGSPDAKPARLAAVRIVGVVASPGQFPAVGASSASGSVYVTPAFVRSNGIRPPPGDAALLIRLRHGAANRDAFLRQMRAAGLGGADIPEVQQTQTAGIQRSIRLESQALWALCVLTGLAAFAIVGQSQARQNLPGLGRSARPVGARLFPRPVGLARHLAGRRHRRGGRLCSRPGRRPALATRPSRLGQDRRTRPWIRRGRFAAGSRRGLVALLTMLASAVPAWTAARTAATVRREGPGPGRARSSAFTSALSRAWRSPAAATGIQMALQPGRGRTAVPVRSATFGATLSIAALTASLVSAASLGHLLTTPRLSGFTWDAFASVEGGLPRAAAALRADPSIAGYTRGGFAGVRIGQLRLMALVLGGSGPARQVITAGVAPAGAGEVALGASTMRDAHTAIGRTVDLMLDQAGGHPKPARMRVVGTVIVPPTPFLVTKLGEGAALALPGYVRIDPGAAGSRAGCRSWCASPPASAATPGSPPSPRTSRASQARTSPPLNGPRTWSAWPASSACRSPFLGCWP